MSGGVQKEATIRSLYREFNRICCEFDQLYRTVAMKMGMSDSAFQTLLAVYDLGEGCTQSEVCDYCCLGKQTIGSSVRKLQNVGLITLEKRVGSRGLGIFLTEEGREVVKERIAPIVEADVDALASVGPEKARLLVQISQEYLAGFNGELSKVTFPGDSDSKGVK